MSTIVAISTAPNVGGIGIVRISGEDCFDIINKIFKAKNKKNIEDINGYTMQYGTILNPENSKVIDEVLVSYFKSPKSYTTENMCEINSHGGMIILKEILDLVLKNGATLAKPGEFTERAFENGRIDLIQAEAVIDLINSKSKKEAEASINQLEGFLSNQIKLIREKILKLMVNIEVSIDYPEYDIDEVSYENAKTVLEDAKNDLEKLLDTFENGKIIKEGIKTAIIGTPNAGKSSLLNKLLREERAIVTEYAGTTRDSIEEQIIIDGIPFRIIDTAGIRQTDNEIEKIGIKKSKEIASGSDLIIAIFDGSKNLDDNDKEILKYIENKKAIIIINKIDLKQQNTERDILSFCKDKKALKLSLKENIGINELYSELVNMFNINEINIDGENIITNERHKNLIEKAINCLNEAINSINNNLPIDIISINIKEILENLAQITGENVSEDIIKEIFSKFCLGK